MNLMYFQGRPPRRLRRHQQRNEKAVYPCRRSDLRRLLLALDEGAANGSRIEIGCRDRRLCGMDGVIGAGRLPSATSLRAS
ncbi:MAG TPA: hypothetical protein GXX19_05005 [Syntrophomonadaceae bacterium]|nr:hypothetical protein [Syntrophomonadaceae bacterium]